MSEIKFVAEAGATAPNVLAAIGAFREIVEAASFISDDLEEACEGLTVTVLSKPVQGEGHAFPHFAIIYSGFTSGYTEYLFWDKAGELAWSEADPSIFFGSWDAYSKAP